MRLYHFTCEHGARRIAESGNLIIPHYNPIVGFSVVWMTHDPNADRDALGLSSYTLGCDRMAHRFTIEKPDTAVPWNSVRARYPHARILEAAHGTRPDLWHVSRAIQEATPLADDIGKGG